MTRRSGSGKGNGRSNTAFTTLKMAVFAPMPRASVITAMAAKPGRFKSERTAYRRSLINESMTYFLIFIFRFMINFPLLADPFEKSC